MALSSRRIRHIEPTRFDVPSSLAGLFRDGLVARRWITPVWMAVLVAILSIAGIPEPCMSGPNQDGTLILALSEGTVYTADPTYCGSATLTDCMDAVTEFNDPGTTAVLNVLAAFSPGSHPRLSGLTFGIVDIDAVLVGHGSCGEFEIPDPAWPGTGSGTAVTWASAQTSLLVEVYWFAASDAAAVAATIELTPNPVHGGFFADDSVPAALDPIAGFGTFGFSGAAGSAPCPPPVVPGACCFATTGNCQFLGENDCDLAGGDFEGVGTDCNPNPCPQPIGACCLDDGDCQEELEIQCLSLGGTFLGVGILCDPFPCPPLPARACCFADFTCEILDNFDCADAGGVYLPGVFTCNPNPCGPVGACCFPDGDCEILGDSECVQQGGVYEGDLVSCTPNPCPPPPEGACCFDNGNCIVLTEALCNSVGGSYLGDDTSCTSCPPAGACCFALDGRCETWTEDRCVSIGGTYEGDSIPCDPNPCPPPPEGACCFPDGTCSIEQESHCMSMAGEYQGDDTTCDLCPLGGACCLADGSCDIWTQSVCEALDGIYQGDGVSCSPNPCPAAGACCFDDGTCQVLVPTVCEAVGGNYLGDGVSCVPNPCPSPCVPFDLAGRPSTDAPPPDPSTFPFAGLRGSLAGTAGESRAALRGPHAGGTLILHSDLSIEYTTEILDYCGLSGLTDCVDAVTRTDSTEPAVIFALAAFPVSSSPRLTGVTFGITFGPCVSLLDWGDCGDFELPGTNWPSSGSGTAVTWGMAQTEDITEVYWFAAQAYLDGVPDLLELGPHPTQGGYFADDSVPIQLDPIADYGAFGFFTNGWVPCASADPLGACCDFDGSCTVTTEAGCTGIYQGDDVSCDPNPCPIGEIGACCFDDLSCEMLGEDECWSVGGIFQGVSVSCDPNPCELGTPVHKTTWGKIKSAYR